MKAQTGSIEITNIEYDCYDHGAKGMKIHSHINVKNWKDKQFTYIVFFYKGDNGSGGKLLSSGDYTALDGHVCTWKKLNVTYDSSVWEDCWVFIPYSALPHDKGRKHYSLYAVIRKNKEYNWASIAKTPFENFYVDCPEGTALEEENTSEIQKNQTKTYKNGKYFGDLKNGLRHGYGTMTYTEGSKYVGEWHNDVYNGQGTFTFSDGEKYVGGFKNGKFDGQGTRIYSGGAKYVGGYKDGKFDGQGTITFSDGSTFVGEWKNNEQNGKGTTFFSDGRKYITEYKNGEEISVGTYIYPDGRTKVVDNRKNSDTSNNSLNRTSSSTSARTSNVERNSTQAKSSNWKAKWSIEKVSLFLNEITMLSKKNSVQVENIHSNNRLMDISLLVDSDINIGLIIKNNNKITKSQTEDSDPCVLRLNNGNKNLSFIALCQVTKEGDLVLIELSINKILEQCKSSFGDVSKWKMLEKLQADIRNNKYNKIQILSLGEEIIESYTSKSTPIWEIFAEALDLVHDDSNFFQNLLMEVL